MGYYTDLYEASQKGIKAKDYTPDMGPEKTEPGPAPVPASRAQAPEPYKPTNVTLEVAPQASQPEAPSKGYYASLFDSMVQADDAPKEFAPRPWLDMAVESVQNIPENIGEVARAAYGAAAYSAPASISAFLEESNPRAHYDIRDRLIERNDAYAKRREAELGGENLILPRLPWIAPEGIKVKNLREAEASAGFSAVSMLASVTGTLAGAALASPSALAGPVGAIPIGKAAIAGGLAAGFAAGYKLDKDSFSRQLLTRLDKDLGRRATAEESEAYLTDYNEIITNHALWEAGPEAVGNMIGLKGLSKLAKISGIKGALPKIYNGIVGGAMQLGGELATETPTYMGQNNAEVDAGLRPESDRMDFANPDHWTKALAAVGPTVIPLVAGMSAAGISAGAIKEAATGDGKAEKSLANAVLLVNNPTTPEVLKREALETIRATVEKRYGAEEAVKVMGRVGQEPPVAPDDGMVDETAVPFDEIPAEDGAVMDEDGFIQDPVLAEEAQTEAPPVVNPFNFESRDDTYIDEETGLALGHDEWYSLIQTRQQELAATARAADISAMSIEELTAEQATLNGVTGQNVSEQFKEIGAEIKRRTPPVEKSAQKAGSFTLTPEILGETFKGATIEKVEGGYNASLPSGVQIYVNEVDRIIVNRSSAKKAGYTDAQIDKAIATGGAGAAWSFDGKHVLKLSKAKGTKFDLSHDSFHAAAELALSVDEYAEMIKDSETVAKILGRKVGSIANEEDVSDAYALWKGDRETGGKYFQKIKDFFADVALKFGHGSEAEGVFRKVESGKVWERTDRAEKAVKVQRGEKYSLGDEGKLSALHSLTPENLIFADNIGGLAVPSIAVVKGDMGMEGYGSITLIGTKDLADPAMVPVFDADAYSSTFPEPEYSKPNKGGMASILSFYDDYTEQFYGGVSGEIYEIEEKSRYGNMGKVISILTGSNSAKAAYLRDVVGRDNIRPIMEDAPLGRMGDYSVTPEVMDFFKNNPKLTSDDARIAELSDIVRSHIKEKYTGDRSGVADSLIKNDFDKNGLLHFSRWEDMRNDQRSIGKKIIDNYANRDKLDKALKGKEEKFKVWVEGIVSPAFGEPTLTISGKEVPYTIDNIVRKMTSGKISAAEKTMTFGEGKARAAASKRYTNLEKLRADAATGIGRVSDIKEARELAGKMSSDYRDAVISYYKYNDTWDALDSSMKAMARFIKSGGSVKSMESALSAEGFRNVPEDVIKMGVEAARALATAPVPYFEAKPQRAVALSEFVGAVVPEGTSKEVKAILKKHGIKTMVYGESRDELARAAAINSLRDSLSKKGHAVLYSLGTQQKAPSGEILFPVMDGNTEVGNLTGTTKKIGGNVTFRLTSIEAEDAVPGLYQDTMRELANKYPGGLIIEKKQIDPDQMAAVRKVFGVVETSSEFRVPTQDMVYGSQYSLGYHGSPHLIPIEEGFRLDKIGTGEGAQAYGHGIYMAEGEGTAKFYQMALSGGPDTFVQGMKYKGEDIISDGARWKVGGERLNEYDPLNTALTIAHENRYGDPLEAVETMIKNGDLQDYEIDEIKRVLLSDDISIETGHLYEVDLPDEHIAKMLDWDKPLSEQPKHVQKALEKDESWLYGKSVKGKAGDNGRFVYKDMADRLGSERAVSEYLNKLGIPGIKYLDATSRGAGEGTRNFVLFDPSIAKIVSRNGEKYSLGGQQETIKHAKAIYSKLEEVAANAFTGMKAQGVKNFLTKQGVKKVEMEAVGLDAFLSSRKPTDKVSREELLDFVKANAVELEDVVLGQAQFEVIPQEEAERKYPETKGWFSDYEKWLAVDRGTPMFVVPEVETQAEAMRAARQMYREDLDEDREGVTHFSKYTEPGAEEGSYREMFVTAPGFGTAEKSILTFKEVRNGVDAYLDGERMGRWDTEKQAREDLQDHPNYSDRIAGKAGTWQDGHSQYSDIKNPIVRLRFNTVEADGKKLMRIEEVQGPNPENQNKMPVYLRDNIYQLAIKRALAYAKENGFDGVALATKPGMTAGETQADRYSLDKQLKELAYNRVTEENRNMASQQVGEYHLEGITEEGRLHNFGSFTENELPGVVGKEMAEKIINGAGVYSNSRIIGGVKGANIFSDIDLRVGSTGLKTLYDTTIPKMLESYSKGKMGEVGYETPGRHPGKFTVIDPAMNNAIVKTFNTVEEAQARADLTPGLRVEEISTMPTLLFTDKTPASYPQYSLGGFSHNHRHNAAITTQEKMWHSELESTLGSKLKDKDQTPESWRKQIIALGDYDKVKRVAVRDDNNVPTGDTTVKTQNIKGEFRQSELKWSGLIPWLYEQEGTVSKQQIMDYTRSQAPKIGEVVLTRPKQILLGYGGELGKVMDRAEEEYLENGESTMTDGLGQTLDVKWHEEGIEVTGLAAERDGDIGDNYRYPDFNAFARGVAAGDFSWFGFPIARFDEQTLPGGDDYTELAITVDGDTEFVNTQHFPFKNVVAHMRFITRTDAAGGRTMHIEEVQSDWQKEMRKRGISAGVDSLPEGYNIVPGKKVGRWDTYLVKGPDGELVHPIESYTPEAAIKAAVRNLNKGVPEAPLAKEWPTTVMKRAIRWAVDNGFDSVSWTTGAQQTERYSRDLRGAVDKIEWDFDGSTFAVTSWKKGEKEVAHDAAFTPEGQEVGGRKNLIDYYGKDVAGKILNGADQGELTGDDLVIGGNSFRNFYDKDLVNRTNKIVKQFGGQVEDGRVSTKQPRSEKGEYQAKDAPAHYLKITEQMRESVPEGAQLWNTARYSLGAVDTELANFKKWFGDSKVVDADGKPLVVYHGTKQAGFLTFDTDGSGKTSGAGAFFTSSSRGAFTYSGTMADFEPTTLSEIIKDPEKYNIDITKNEDGTVTATSVGGYEYTDDTVEGAINQIADQDGLFDEEPGNYPVYLSLQNPLIIDAEGANWDSIGAQQEWFATDEEGEILEYFTNEEDANHFRDTSDGVVDIEESNNPDTGQSTDDIAREARQDGYDGVIIKNVIDEGGYGQGYGWDSEIYIAFSPTQIKSSLTNTGDYSLTDARISYSLGSSERWVSQLQTAADNLKQNKGSGDQMLAMIRKSGVPEYAIEWTELDAFLAGKKSVTKDETVKYVRSKDVHLEETVKHEPTEEEIDTFLDDEMGEGQSREDAMEYLQDDEDRPEYSRYVTPGGTNYREILLTLPTEFVPAEKPAMLTELPSDYIVMSDQMANPDQRYGVAPEAQGHARAMSGWHPTEEAARKEAVDLLNNRMLSDWSYENEKGRKSSGYTGPHFPGTANILAWLRVNERVDADGSKVLFIEEIQSDWGQAIRKTGVEEKYAPDEVTPVTLAEEPAANRPDLFWYFKVPGNVFQIPKRRYATEKEAISYIISDKVKHGGSPNMPYKGTRQWSMLAMKRAISYATEQGMDKIAWTTGKMQQDRYDLSKQVDKIEYYHGSEILVAWKDGEQVIQKSQVSGRDLEGEVGKEAAAKILKLEGTPRVLEGLDLAVGGAGMLSFYDTLLVNNTNKLLRKLKSGSEVGVSKFGEFESWSFPLTTELRNKALGGMEQYSLGEISRQDESEYIEAMGQASREALAETEIQMAKTLRRRRPAAKRIQHLAKMGDIVKATSDLTKNIYQAQQALHRYIMQSLPISERGRREIISRIAKLALPKTQKTREKYFAEALGMIDDRHEEVAKADAIDKMVRLLKKSRPKNKGGHPEGKMTPETYTILAGIERTIAMNPDDAAVELEKAITGIEKLRGLEHSSIAKEQEVYAKAQMDVFLLTRFADLKSRNSRDVIGAYEDIQTVVQSGKFIWQAQEAARKATNDELRLIAEQDITGKESISQQEIERRNRGRQARERTAWGKLMAGLKAIDDTHQSWEWFLDKMSRYSEGSTLEGRMTDHFRLKAHEATTNFDEGIYQETSNLRDAAERIFGAKGRKLETILEKNAIPGENSGVFRYHEEGPAENLTISQNEAYKLWQWLQDPSLTKSMTKHGYTADTVKEIEKFLDKKVLEWAKWQLYDYYPNYYESVNSVYKKMYHVDLPYNPMYTPMVRERPESPTEEMLLEENTPYASTMNGSLKNRVENNLAPRLVDGDGLISQHITKMEHFKAWSEVIREMRSVLGSRKVMGSIQAFHGDKAKKVLMRFIDDFARGGVDRAMTLHGLDAMRGAFVKSVIGMNPVVFMKQLTSIPAYLTDMPVYHFTMGVADFATNPIGKAKILMRSKRMQARYRKGWERDIAASMKKAAPAGIADVSRLTDAMMFPTKLGDKWAILVGGWSQYKMVYDKARKQGMSKDKADEKAMLAFEMATERSQQASDVKDQGQVQRFGSFGKLFTMFMTSPQAYYRHISGGYRNLFAGRGSVKDNLQRIAVAQFILPMLFQLVASGFEWDDDDQLRAFIMGPLNGLFLIRDFAEPVVNGLTGGKMFGSDGGVPLLTASTSLAMAAGEAVKIVNGDPAEASKLIDKTLSGLSKFAGIPYDPIKRWGEGIYESATGETEHPVRRSMGFSKYALDRGEEKVNKSNRRLRPKAAARPLRSRPERR